MAGDRDRALALEFPPLTFDVERGRLRAFTSAIGEQDPTYLDVEAARAAGHPDVPVPPTLYFSMNLEQADPFWYLHALGTDLRFILHGEQSFTYHAQEYAGDRLMLQSRICDVFAKRGGALEFLVNDTEVRRGDELIAETRTVIVVRNPEARA